MRKRNTTSDSSDEIARRKALVKRLQADPAIQKMVREAIESLDRGEGVRWEDVKRKHAGR